MQFIGAICMALALFGCGSTAMNAAKLYLQQNEPEKAKAQLELVLETEPANPEAHFMLGRIYGTEGDYAAMVASFEKSLEASDRFAGQISDQRQHYWVQHFNQGVGFVNQNQPDFAGAATAFEKATVLQPDSLNAWRNLAFVHYQSEDFSASATTFEHILAVAPGDSAALYNLGILYRNQNEHSKTIQLLGQLVEHHPNHLDALLTLAAAHEQQGNFGKAIEWYQQAVEADPTSGMAYYNLGNLHWRMEDYPQAIEAYDRAVELNVNDKDALYNLAISYLANDDMDNALPLLEDLSTRMPDNHTVWRELGRVYAHKGMIEKSEAAYAEADKLQE